METAEIETPEPEVTEEVVEETPEEVAAETPPEEPEEIVVSIGDEPPAEQERAPEWVRELRKQNREKDRLIRELQAKVVTENKPVAKKPKLEDFDYDTEQFERALDQWKEQELIAKAREAEAKKAEEAEMAQWNERLSQYGKAKAELKVKDFDDAEETAKEVLDVAQQAIVVQGADNPALIVYALGKNPNKAKELAAIKDPVKFAFAVAKLEKDLKVTNRKAAPPPERVVQGTSRISGAVDSTLERLREEAARTGDYTKVNQYKRAQRAKTT